jgi:hypothetical protein
MGSYQMEGFRGLHTLCLVVWRIVANDKPGEVFSSVSPLSLLSPCLLSYRLDLPSRGTRPSQPRQFPTLTDYGESLPFRPLPTALPYLYQATGPV